MPPEARGDVPVPYTTKIDLYYYGDLLQQLVFWAAGDKDWDRVVLPWTLYNRHRFLTGYGTEPTAARLAQLSMDCAANDPGANEGRLLDPEAVGCRDLTLVFLPIHLAD